MVIPLKGTSRALGVLNIVRKRGSASFSATDLEMAAAFASQASVALALSNARADQQRVSLLEDRDRIARDLHDHVIQQLFAVGLSLQGLAAVAGKGFQGALGDLTFENNNDVRVEGALVRWNGTGEELVTSQG